MIPNKKKEREIKNHEKTVTCLLILMSLCFALYMSSCVRQTSNAEADSFIKQIEENYPADNFIEEMIEHQIQQKTGIEIDFSARSPEE